MTCGAGALDSEEALLGAHATTALAGLTRRRPRSLRRTGAGACFAGDGSRHADLGFPTLESILDRDFEVIAKVRATRIRLGGVPTTHEITEHLVEYIGETGSETARPGAGGTVESAVAELVVGGTFLIVLEDVVSLVDLLELLLGGVVVGIAIGVVLHRELAVGLLDCVRVGVPRHAQQVVVVRFRHTHHLSTERRPGGSREGAQGTTPYAISCQWLVHSRLRRTANIGAIQKKPSVIETPEGDAIGIRHKMFLSHAYDHRVVDGALGGMFVRKVADYLEEFDPNREI